ncbi:MAG TPA: sulfite exporter TauE/SafE family protein [Candidatus Pristimantibacillus sp.]|nr:sulfite exporter TauE/SafE family protein [Candidatus Pristimantibacillus sp.]
MDVWFFVAAFLAGIVGTVAGFGAATVLLPVALLFFDFKTALVLVAFTHLFSNLGRLAFFHKRVVWRVALYFCAIGIPGTLLGALLVNHINSAELQAGLGIFLIGYGIFAFFEPAFRLKPAPFNMLAGGLSSGVLAGLIGTGGALRTVFLAAYRMPKLRYIATSGVIALAVDGARIPIYLKDGLLASNYYWMLPVLFVVAVAGSYAGKRAASKISQAVFTRIVLACLVLAGIKLVINYF